MSRHDPLFESRVLVNFDRGSCQGLCAAARHILLRWPRRRGLAKSATRGFRKRLATR